MTLAFVQLAFNCAWAVVQGRMKQERAFWERRLQVGWRPTGNLATPHAPTDSSGSQQSTHS